MPVVRRRTLLAGAASPAADSAISPQRWCRFVDGDDRIGRSRADVDMAHTDALA